MFSKILKKYNIDRCDIYAATPVKNGGVTSFAEELRGSDLPCRLTYLGGENSVKTDTRSYARAKAKLFLNTGVAVPPGARIAVRRGDKTLVFNSAGICSFYPSHTEVWLETSEDLL